MKKKKNKIKTKSSKKQKVNSAKTKKVKTKKPKLAKSEQLITKNMLIGEVVQKYPEAVEVMFNYGLHCVGCGIAGFETIEQGSLAHGLTPKQIDEMVAKMNEKVKTK